MRSSPRVWNLGAVIWFPFPISSLVFLPSVQSLFVLSFFCDLSMFLTFFSQENSQFLLRGCNCLVWLKVVVLYGWRLLLLFCMAQGCCCCFVWLKVLLFCVAQGCCCCVWLKVVVVLCGSRWLLLFCMAEGCCFVWLKVVLYGWRLLFCVAQGCCFVWLKVVVLCGSRLLLFCVAQGGGCFVWLKVVVLCGSRLLFCMAEGCCFVWLLLNSEEMMVGGMGHVHDNCNRVMFSVCVYCDLRPMVVHLHGVSTWLSWFQGDARYFVSNSKDQTIKLWDTRFSSPKEGVEVSFVSLLSSL